MGNMRVSMTDPSLSAGPALAWLPGAAVAWAVPAGAAVPDEPPHAATSAAVMLAPRQAHSTRRAPPFASVTLPHFPRSQVLRIAPARALIRRKQATHTADSGAVFPLLPIVPGPGHPPRLCRGVPGCARECCAVNYRWRGGEVPAVEEWSCQRSPS